MHRGFGTCQGPQLLNAWGRKIDACEKNQHSHEQIKSSPENFGNNDVEWWSQNVQEKSRSRDLL